MGEATGHHSRLQETGLAFLLYLALTILLTYPLSIRPASGVILANPDTELFMWTLAWDAHAFVNHPLSIFDANIYYPERRTLAYSENLIGTAFFAAPILWLGGSPVLALNLVTLLTIVLCGLGGFILGRRLGLSAASAFICGLVFAFSPARFFRISQMHLTAVQWMPFTLAYLHGYLEGGRARDLRLAIGFFTLQALTTGHGAVFLLVAVLGLLIYHVALGQPLQLAKRVRDFGLTGVLLLSPALLIVLPYRIVQVEMGLRRALGKYGASPESFLASPSHVQTFLVSLFPSARINENATGILFPGFLAMALAALAFLSFRDRSEQRVMNARHLTIFYTLLAVAGVLLAAGPPIGIWPLVYWLPGMNFIRGPARFMILATLAIAVLTAVGVEQLRARTAPARRQLLAVGVSVLLVGEFISIPFGVVPYEVKIPSADRWLMGQPKPFVVAEVPVEANERYQAAYMLHAMAHWQKTVHGYSGMQPPLHDRLFRQLQRFPDDESLTALSDLGVTYVVVHADQYKPGEWPPVEERLQRYGNWLRIQYQDAGARVYMVLPRRP